MRYNPLAVEYDCEDPNDYNCDGSVGYEDADGDGHAACTECDDSNPAVPPDASEICNGIDDDCDNEIDADDSNLADGAIFYGDSDGDGHGGQQYEAIACEAFVICTAGLYRRLPQELLPYCIRFDPRSPKTFLDALNQTENDFPPDNPNDLLQASAYREMDRLFGVS